MHFVSDDVLATESYKEESSSAYLTFEDDENDKKPIVIFDIETYPGDRQKHMEAFLLICWKYLGEGKEITAMINPSPEEVKEFIGSYRLIGFNNRSYDNHIIYARAIGMSIEECNRRSQLLINGPNETIKNAQKFKDAYGISYADILDFSTKKQSLKKWEVELGISHVEMSIPWDRPCPKELWPKVVEYCKNDVLATEAVFNHLQSDFKARQILADLSGLKVNDTTNQHTLAIVFGKEKKPTLVYTNLATGEQSEGR
jgi:hypothetical protein